MANIASQGVHKTSGNGEAEPVSFDSRSFRTKPLKAQEQFLMQFDRDAASGVRHLNPWTLRPSVHFDGHSAPGSIFDCIAEKIRQYLAQNSRIGDKLAWRTLFQRKTQCKSLHARDRLKK